MKENSEFLNFIHPEPYLLDTESSQLELHIESSKASNNQKFNKRQFNKRSSGLVLGSTGVEMFNSFLAMWDRLITIPELKSSDKNTSITDYILSKESQMKEKEMVRTVLSENLDLPLDSLELISAIEKSNKIYHEDYPGNYILEYNGNRLGMFELNTSFDSNNKLSITYKFQSGVKSFKWLC